MSVPVTVMRCNSLPPPAGCEGAVAAPWLGSVVWVEGGCWASEGISAESKPAASRIGIMNIVFTALYPRRLRTTAHVAVTVTCLTRISVGKAETLGSAYLSLICIFDRA